MLSFATSSRHRCRDISQEDKGEPPPPPSAVSPGKVAMAENGSPSLGGRFGSPVDTVLEEESSYPSSPMPLLCVAALQCCRLSPPVMPSDRPRLRSSHCEVGTVWPEHLCRYRGSVVGAPPRVWREMVYLHVAQAWRCSVDALSKGIAPSSCWR